MGSKFCPLFAPWMETSPLVPRWRKLFLPMGLCAIPDRLTGSGLQRPLRRLQSGLKRSSGESEKSSTVCGIGSSPASVIGGRPFPLFIATRAGSFLFRRRSFPSGCPWMLRYRSTEATPSITAPIGSKQHVPPAAARRGGRRTPWIPLSALPGTICAISLHGTIKHPLISPMRLIGCL